LVLHSINQQEADQFAKELELFFGQCLTGIYTRDD